MNDPFVTHIVGYQKNILSVLFSNVIFVVSIQKLYCIWYFKNCFLFPGYVELNMEDDLNVL